MYTFYLNPLIIILTISADILNICHQRNKMVNGKTPLIAAVDADSRKCMLLLIRVLYLHLSLFKLFIFYENVQLPVLTFVL
jgi:hypothetical protein